MGQTDVPLRNWGGFAINWNWTYDAIEKLVLSGLGGRAVLNTKPMTRMEMARIVAKAVENIRGDDGWRYNDRRDLEDLLYRLVDEFEPELAKLGVEPISRWTKPQGFFFIKPLDQLQARVGFASDDFLIENNQGDFLRDGANGRFASFSRFLAGDFFSVALTPEVRLDDEGIDGSLFEGYAKLSGFGVELSAGRESMWWGPGFHGSMLFSNNAQPLDMIRFSTEAFFLPWYLKYLGLMKFTFALIQLEEDRDFPHAKIVALRLDNSLFPFLELGFSPAVMYNGEGQPDVKFYQIPELIYTAIFAEKTTRKGKFGDTDTLYSMDATLRFSNIDRYLPIGRDIALYGELGVDDVNKLLGPIPIPRKPAFLAGVFIQNFFQLPKTDFRFEYAQTSSISFIDNTYTDGFSFKGRPIAHFIGTGGRDIYTRVTRSLQPNLLLGLESGYSKIGLTKSDAPNVNVKEKRLFSSVDLSYQLRDNLSLFGRFWIQRFENFNFVSGDKEIVPAFSFEVTYSFYSIPHNNP